MSNPCVTHFYTGGAWNPETRGACGARPPLEMGAVHLVRDIENVSCAACREKYFGAAGFDPLKSESTITD